MDKEAIQSEKQQGCFLLLFQLLYAGCHCVPPFSPAPFLGFGRIYGLKPYSVFGACTPRIEGQIVGVGDFAVDAVDFPFQFGLFDRETVHFLPYLPDVFFDVLIFSPYTLSLGP